MSQIVKRYVTVARDTFSFVIRTFLPARYFGAHPVEAGSG